ncbi:MAG TPA: DUF4239 domain-containing protein [Gammaproteobacteria bacterium]
MFVLVVVFLVLGLFAAMVGAAEAGRRIGVARLARSADGLAKGGGSADAATFALLGLLVAFTFSGAAARFQDRRDLIADEANAIGTAYLRLDLLPSDAQPPLRDLFRRYADVRVTVYGQVLDDAATEAKLRESGELQAAIWTMAASAVKREGTPPSTSTLVIGALNEMIDITGIQTMATRSHPPAVVFLLLVAMSVLCALLVGYATSQNTARSWLHTLTFAAVISLTVYVIIDLEFPRVGLIRVDTADDVLLHVRDSMG